MKAVEALVGVLHHLLVAAHPPAFRRRFGDEIRAAFAAGLQSRRGAAGRVRYLGAGLADQAQSLAAEWWRVLRPASARPGWSRGGLDRLRQDVAVAMRALRRQPALALTVLVTLGLGIGATAAIVSLVDATLFRPLPVAEPGRVVGVFGSSEAFKERSGYGLDGGLSYSDFRALESSPGPLSAAAGFIDVEVGLEAAGAAEQLTVGAVSGGYFSVLGVPPAAGRLLGPADDQPDAAAHVAVLGDGLWARLFDRAPDAIGREIRLGGTPYTVVGIAPRGFRGTRLASRPSLWVPLGSIRSLRAGGIWMGALGDRMLGDHPLGWVATIGRLAPGMTVDAATDRIEALLASRHATGSKRHATVAAIGTAATLGDRAGLVRFVTLLGAVVVLTLLIACMNVATLMSARLADRSRELTLRSVLGASRARLVRQLFVETLVLTGLGALAAIPVAAALLRVLSVFALPGDIAVGDLGLGIDARLVCTTAAAAMLAALLVGLGPAIRASSARTREALGVHGSAARVGPRGALVAGQVALSVVLLVCASLFLRSLRAGLAADLGFDPGPVAAVSVDLFRYGYNGPRAEVYYREGLERAGALPGAQAAALATHVPLSTLGRMAFDAPAGLRTPEDPVMAGVNSVTGSYFRVMGIPLVEGRTFDETEILGTPRVAVVNESAARALFGAASPLGRTIRLYGARGSVVVGVVRDAGQESVQDRGVPMVYQHFFQERPTGGVSVLVRATGAGAAVERFLVEVPPLDRVSFGLAAATLTAAALLALALPARRALRTDPLLALRRD